MSDVIVLAAEKLMRKGYSGMRDEMAGKNRYYGLLLVDTILWQRQEGLLVSAMYSSASEKATTRAPATVNGGMMGYNATIKTAKY